MKVIPTNLRKALYRRIRYHWLVEWAQARIRRSKILELPEVGTQLHVLPGDIIIDCGANVGDVTSRFVRTGAKIYAFEPNPLVFDILKKRFKILPSVECRNQGVMDRECTLSLRVPDTHGEWDHIETTVSGSFLNHWPAEIGHKEVEIGCINLGDFIRSLGRRVRVLKIDIEGAEIALMNRLLDIGVLDSVDYVFVETHEKLMPELLDDTNALRNRIREAGLTNKINLEWP